nr:hypothetical protein CFP56_54482 [Quercus suber]
MADQDEDAAMKTIRDTEFFENGQQPASTLDRAGTEHSPGDSMPDEDWHNLLEDVRLLIPYEYDGDQVYLKVRHYAQRLVTLAEYNIDFADTLPDKHDHESLGLLLEYLQEAAEHIEKIAFDSSWKEFILEADEVRPGYGHILDEMQTSALDNMQAAQQLCENILPHYRLDVEQKLRDFMRKTYEVVKDLGPTLESAGLNGNWHYEWSIGEGGFGDAGLWFRTDQNGRIVEVRACTGIRH